MTEPLSARNPRVVRLGRLAHQASARRDEGAYVIEGFTLVADALTAGITLGGVFVEAAAAEHPTVARARADGVPVHVVVDGALRPAVATRSPQPVAAIAPRVPISLGEALAAGDFVVVLAGVADPGNAGTLVRTAEASGASAVVFTAGSVDAFGPRCVRASAGAGFRLPVATGVDPADLLPALGSAGFRRLGLVVRDGTAYDEADLVRPIAVLVGNEAGGLGAVLGAGPAGEVDEWLTIPMGGGAESLNVAMAATVVCFEVRRQRRSGKASA